MRYFANTHRILIEPSSATTIAALLENKVDFKNHKDIIVVICGGVGISFELLTEYLAK